MQVKLTERSKYRGKVTILPASAGECDVGAIRGLAAGSVRVGDDVGETTVLQVGDQQVVVISSGPSDRCVDDTFRRVGGIAAKWLGSRQVKQAGVDLRVTDSCGCANPMSSLCEGLILGAFRFDEHKSSKKRPTQVKVDVLVDRVNKKLSAELSQARHTAEAVNYAREVAHQPPNVIHPVALAARARKLAATCGLRCTVLDEKQLARHRMGGLLAVGQGSAKPSRLIVLNYAGAGGGKPVILVGKAITFDTGGYSIKSKDGILGMKYDKCGGTAVLGVMKAVAALKPKVPVVGIIAAAENMISGGAYRPDDIITTMSGKTVEIVSADAEGRMVLCDALTYAQQEYTPRAVIDLATLTGGVVVALGKNRAGLFCNDTKLGDALAASGDRVHERLWPLPLDDEYLDGIKGNDSDLRNSGGREGHAILGAVFLKQFVEQRTRWAHLDIAGMADVDKDQPYCPKGATGFGVRLLVDYLLSLR